MRGTFVCALLAGALAVAALPVGAAPGYETRTYSQTYQVAAQGAITVICPSPDRDPTSQWGLFDHHCVPTMDGPGVPAEEQMWIGGVGIDLPLDALPQRVVVRDASGTPTAAGMCIDHDMDNLCGPSDADHQMGEEKALFFCGEASGLSEFFGEIHPMAGMTTQHIDVWVRTAGNTGYFMGYDAPLCSGLPLEGQGGLGLGTRGVVTIEALVPTT